MKRIILLSTIILAAFVSHAQCSADFTWTTSGNTVQFTNTSSGTNFYNWDFGNGAYSSVTSPTHTYWTPGTYDVCLTAYYQDSISGNSCFDTICQQILIQDSLGGSSCSADFTWTTSANTVFFNNTSTGTNMNDWSFGDGGSSSAINPTYTYSAPGTYWVCLYSYYDDSLQVTCADSTCYPITIIDSTGGGGSSCNADFTWTTSGNTVFFNNTSTGTNMNDWSFGDGGSSSATNPTYTYSAPGTYWVCLYSYYDDSLQVTCADSVCYPITIIDSTGGGGSSCNADFTYSVSGTTVSFNNTSTGTNMNYWSFDDGGSSTDINPTHTYASSGTYWVCLYSYYDDSLQTICDDSVCYQITVFDSLDSTASAEALSLSEFQLYPNPTSSVINIRFDELPGNSHALIVDMLGREMIEVELDNQLTEIHVADFPKGVYLVQLRDANNRIISISRFVRD